MAEALRPRFELFGRSASLHTETSQRIPEGMRIEVREVSRFECCLEDRSDGRGSPRVTEPYVLCIHYGAVSLALARFEGQFRSGG